MREHPRITGVPSERVGAAMLVAIPALAIAAAALAVRGSDVETAWQGAPDSLYAVQALAAVRGISPLACDLTVRSLGAGWWGGHSRQPDTHAEFLDLQRWMAGPSSDAAAVRVLAATLGDPDGCARRVAARLLGHNRHPSASDALLRGLASADPEMRTVAAIGLGVSQQRAAGTRLIAALADQAPSVRAAASWALGELDDPVAKPHLISLLEHDRDPAVRRAAAWALGEMK